MKDYGYKICYSEKGHKRVVKAYFLVRSYTEAVRIKKSFAGHSGYNYDRENYKRRLKKPTWYIVPITRREVLRGIWREVPL